MTNQQIAEKLDELYSLLLTKVPKGFENFLPKNARTGNQGSDDGGDSNNDDDGDGDKKDKPEKGSAEAKKKTAEGDSKKTGGGGFGNNNKKKKDSEKERQRKKKEEEPAARPYQWTRLQLVDRNRRHESTRKDKSGPPGRSTSDSSCPQG